jgi:hypothetical protein
MIPGSASWVLDNLITEGGGVMGSKASVIASLVIFALCMGAGDGVPPLSGQTSDAAAAGQPAAAPQRATTRLVRNLQLAPASVEVPVRMDRYVVFRMPVGGSGDFRFSLKWTPADVALEMRVFAPGRQEPVVKAGGRGALDLAFDSAGALPQALLGPGDWMIELRRAEAAAHVPPSAVEPEVTPIPVAPSDEGTPRPRLRRLPARLQPLDRPAAAQAGEPARTVQPGAATMQSGVLSDKLPGAPIQGTLTARWPGMNDGQILDVTARVAWLRRLIEVQRKEQAALRAWQTQWDEAVKAEFLANGADDDMEDLLNSIEATQQAIDKLQQSGAEEQSLELQDACQKAQQTVNMLSQMLKKTQETQSAIVRNMK